MAHAPVFLEHPSSLHHDTGAHPEQPARITAISRELEQRDWLGFERVTSPRVARETLTAVHPEGYVAAIERLAERGGAQLDPDTVVSSGSFDAALHSAGGAVGLVDMLLDRSAPSGFSVHRPPGHHAERAEAMGFCLFNNIAVAARHAVAGRGLERVLVLDWDVHHGNGTNDIFHASRRFCSSPSTSRRCTRARVRPRMWVRGRAPGTRSTCRCPPAPATRSTARSSITSSCQSPTPTSPSCC